MAPPEERQCVRPSARLGGTRGGRAPNPVQVVPAARIPLPLRFPKRLCIYIDRHSLSDRNLSLTLNLNFFQLLLSQFLHSLSIFSSRSR